MASPASIWLLALALAVAGSGSTAARTATAPPPHLLFRSGFEDGTRLAAPWPCWPTGCWQQIAGSDSTSGFSWPPRVAGGGGRFLLLTDPVRVLPGTIGHYMFNRLETVNGPSGVPTRALYQQISRNIHGTGPMGTSAAQNEFQFQPRQDVRELYLSFRLKLQPDLGARMRGLPAGPGIRAGGTWRGLFAVKTGGRTALGEPADDGDYRIEAYVTTYGGGTPYWAIIGDNNAGGDAPGVNEWSMTNHRVPVPAGDWCKLEFYWRRSDHADGRVWMAVNGRVVADRRGANTGARHLPVNRIIAPLLYGGGRMPLYQWVDDIEVWSGMPPLTR